MRSGSAETFPGSNLAAVMLESTLGLIDAVFCCGLALAVLLLRPRALSQWSFVAGMIALGAESALNALSRCFERQCDRYALARTGLREAYRSAFAKLARLNKSDPDPNPVVVWLFHDHPPIRARIAMAEAS